MVFRHRFACRLSDRSSTKHSLYDALLTFTPLSQLLIHSFRRAPHWQRRSKKEQPARRRNDVSKPSSQLSESPLQIPLVLHLLQFLGRAKNSQQRIRHLLRRSLKISSWTLLNLSSQSRRNLSGFRNWLHYSMILRRSRLQVQSKQSGESPRRRTRVCHALP